jgi:hypothetical protein
MRRAASDIESARSWPARQVVEWFLDGGEVDNGPNLFNQAVADDQSIREHHFRRPERLAVRSRIP